MANADYIDAVDTLNSRIRHAHAITEALLNGYVQQGPGSLDHAMSPEQMCDTLEAISNMLEQARDASSAASAARHG